MNMVFENNTKVARAFIFVIPFTYSYMARMVAARSIAERFSIDKVGVVKIDVITLGVFWPYV